MAQTAALSFCYAPPTSQQYDLCENKDLRNACQQIVAQHNCQIVITANDASQTIKSLVDTPTNYNITLTGAFNTLMAARGDLLRNCPLKIQLTLNIPASECSNLSLIRDHCNKIEAETHTTITIAPPPARRSSFSSENSVAILITGSPDHAELGRVRVLVMLDELANLRTETVKIPLKFQYLICGRRRAGLQPIIEETATNIYLPSPFITPSILDQMPEDEFAPPIYITGEPSNVSRVKDMLMKLSTQKAKSMYHKETMLHEQKIDWMLLHRRDELRKIMHDNGSFIELPLVGSGENRIAVYAENRVNVERTLRALNFLACSIYKAYFYFHDHDGTVYDASDGHSFFDSISNLAGLASQLSQVSGAEVTYKTESGCVEVLGTERAIRNVYQRLQGMSFLKAFHHYSIFRVESSNEQRDFISGKKNGKINKIMKTSGAKIRFLPGISDYNFIIEVESTSFTKALDGLTLLQEELPAEISFYVPESYHKRIIGVGGKNIQRIMKKYGVYVKFSNTEEFASLGGYYDNEDNVVARTPMKNQINLDNLRHAVMELIHPKDRDFVTQVIAVPFRLHRLLIHKYQTSFLTEEVTKKTNTRVLWPDGELASDTVTLIGPEAQMSLAVQMIQSIVPDEYDLHVPYTAVLVETIQCEEFQSQVVARLAQMNIRLDLSSLSSMPSPPTSSSSSSTSPSITDGPDFVLPLKMNKANMDALPAALNILNDFLRSRRVTMYDDAVRVTVGVGEPKIVPTAVRSDTITTRATTTAIQQPPARSSSYPFFNAYNTEETTSTWKNFPDRSVDNIRAIFDAPMDLTEQERIVLSNYRYHSMGMPSSGFGLPNVTTTPANKDIWATPGQRGSIGGGGTSKVPGAGYPGPVIPPVTESRSATSSRMFAMDEPPSTQFLNMGMQAKDFDPYNDDDDLTAALKSSQPIQPPMPENHFKVPAFGPGPYGTYPTRSPPADPQQLQRQNFMFGPPSSDDPHVSSILSSFDPSNPNRPPAQRRESSKGRPPPGIDI